MKKSIFVLSILMPAIAFAQTTTPPAANTTPVVAVVPAVTETPAVAVVAPAVVPTVVIPDKKEEPSLNPLTGLDLKDADVSVTMTKDNKVQLSGSIPQVCADRVSINDVKRYAGKSDDELKDASIEKAEDLKDYSTTAKIQISYSSDSQNKTLKDCVANNKDAVKVALENDPHFTRAVFFDDQIGIASIDGESMNLKSSKYLELEANMKDLNCKDCNNSWAKAKTHLDQARSFDSPLLSSMMGKLLESSLTDMDSKIEAVKTSTELGNVRKDLLEMSQYMSTDEQRGLEAALFGKLIEKNLALTTASPTSVATSKGADFERDTYNKMLALPGLPEDQRADLKKKAADMAPGKLARIDWLSKIDGDNSEVMKFVRDNNARDQMLNRQMRQACMSPFSAQCGALQNEFYTNQQGMGEIQSRYTLANNQNWTNIFASWDKSNVQYNPAWKQSFIQPVSPNMQSMPDVYNPNDKRYQNIDTTKLFQPNIMSAQMAQPQGNPLFMQTPSSVIYN